MTIHKALHPRDDVYRLYVSRRKAGKEHPSIENAWICQYEGSKTALNRTKDN